MTNTPTTPLAEVEAMERQLVSQQVDDVARRLVQLAQAIEREAKAVGELTEYSDDITRRFKRQVHEIGPQLIAERATAEARAQALQRKCERLEEAVRYVLQYPHGWTEQMLRTALADDGKGAAGS